MSEECNENTNILICYSTYISALWLCWIFRLLRRTVVERWRPEQIFQKDIFINIHNSWESHLLFRGPCSMIKWQLPVTYIWIEHNIHCLKKEIFFQILLLMRLEPMTSSRRDKCSAFNLSATELDKVIESTLDT